MNWLYVLFISECLLFLFAFFLSRQDIMAPSVIMCVMFILSTSVAMLAANEVKIKFGFESFEILFAGILTFILAEAVFRKWFQRGVTRVTKTHFLQALKDQPFYAVHIQGWLLVIALIMDILIVFWYVIEIRRNIGSTGGAIRAVIGQSVATSWDEALINPILNQFMKINKALGYIAGFVLIQRILVKEREIFQTIGLILLMILGQVAAFVTASRGGILQFLSALLVEYNILWHQKHGWHRNVSWKLVRIGIVCITVGVPVFYYAVVWMGRTSVQSLRTMTEATNIYLGYPIYSFDLYVKNPPLSFSTGFGEESLVGLNVFLKKYLGIDTFVRNVNLETRYSNGHFLGNVYTFFRRPLHDFGFAGMLIFTIFVAFFFSSIYYGKIKWRSRTIRTDCWSMIYGYFFYWIVLSSIDQYSQVYISLGVCMNMLVLVVGYRLLNGIKATSAGLKYRRKRIYVVRKE